LNHIHHKAQHSDIVRAPVTEVAEENGEVVFRMRGGEFDFVHSIAELFKQGAQLAETAVNVPNDVKRTGFIFFGSTPEIVDR
jgi:hypothetical protein